MSNRKQKMGEKTTEGCRGLWWPKTASGHPSRPAPASGPTSGPLRAQRPLSRAAHEQPPA